MNIHGVWVCCFFCSFWLLLPRVGEGQVVRDGGARERVVEERGARGQAKYVVEGQGAIIRGDTTGGAPKELALVFTGDEFAEGATVVRSTLLRQQIPASFFLTGRFYGNPALQTLIRQLKNDGDYLGGHSDQHLLYCDWTKRDSLLVTRSSFREDLEANYKKMAGFGIRKEDASYFLPAYEWYNDSIARWTGEMGLKLVNYTPGTLSTADYTWPEMGQRYRGADEVYRSIIGYEASHPNGLKGFILLVHMGTDPRRTDKFYNKLDELVSELKAKGYRFVRIDKLL